MPKTPAGRWGQHHIATILGLQPGSWSKLLNGQIFPARLQTMQKIEVVFGWPVSEQVQLIPPYWEWPEQASGGNPAGEPTDLRYAMMLHKVVAEWSEANPRTTPTRELGLHPKLQPVNGVDRGTVAKRTPRVKAPEPVEAPRPLTLTRNPLVKR